MNDSTPAGQQRRLRWWRIGVGAGVLAAVGVYTANALVALLALVVAAGVAAVRALLDTRNRIASLIGTAAERQATLEQPDLHLGPFLEPISTAIAKLAESSRTSSTELQTAIQQERIKTLELEMLANRLEDTGRRLQQANEELAAFAYSASHDLASPLRVIEGLTGILAEDYADRLDDTGRQHLSTIRGSSARLIALVQDLLVMSHLRSPDPDDVHEVVLGDLVRDLITDLRPSLPETAQLQVTGTLPEVEAPPERVQQVLQNLISNGFKFNRSDVPTVTIDGWTENGMGIVRVTDNGIGIPEHQEAEVFGLFTRLHGDDAFAGTGAGLAIARRAARSLSGELWIERTSPAGTTFVLALPTQHAGDTQALAGAFGPMRFSA